MALTSRLCVDGPALAFRCLSEAACTLATPASWLLPESTLPASHGFELQGYVSNSARTVDGFGLEWQAR